MYEQRASVRELVRATRELRARTHPRTTRRVPPILVPSLFFSTAGAAVERACRAPVGTDGRSARLLGYRPQPHRPRARRGRGRRHRGRATAGARRRLEAILLEPSPQLLVARRPSAASTSGPASSAGFFGAYLLNSVQDPLEEQSNRFRRIIF